MRGFGPVGLHRVEADVRPENAASRALCRRHGFREVGEFATIHQMDCRDPDVIYTAEINNWRSQKILLKPQAMKTTSQQN